MEPNAIQIIDFAFRCWFPWGIMIPREILDLWVVEWSERQQTFHLQTVEQMLQANWRCYLHSRDPDVDDYRVVGIARTLEGGHEQRRQLIDMLDRPPH